MCSQPKTTDDKPRHRWYQYSLRTLLLLMLLVSVGMSLVANRMRRAERQREAVAAIKRSGGLVWYEHEDGRPFPSPTPPPGPLWLRRLLGDDFFRRVVAAYVASDADFKYLGQLDCLTRVCCRGTLGETGLMHILELRHPRDPSTPENAEVSPEFEILTTLTKLEDLDLDLTNIGDAELERIKAMPRLHRLDLSGTEITDAGLRHLEELPRLQQLYLSMTEIGDAGVEHLKGLRQLTDLELLRTRITDAGLQHLAGLENLRHLNIKGTKVTEEGVAKIKNALPACEVESSDPIRLPHGEMQEENRRVPLPNP
ncbi:MAG: hypothetical protein ABR915_09055 [Thermoguttaceae bacterium]|jgi:hypothetical protein